MKKGALRNFRKFTGNQLCQKLFFSKFAGLRTCGLAVLQLRSSYLAVLQFAILQRYNLPIAILQGVLQKHRPPTGNRPLTSDH